MKKILVLIFVSALFCMLNATTYNTPVLDGTISTTDDWDANEDMGAPAGQGTWNLWLTWDATYLYIGFDGPSWRPNANDEVNIYIDAATAPVPRIIKCLSMEISYPAPINHSQRNKN